MLEVRGALRSDKLPEVLYEAAIMSAGSTSLSEGSLTYQSLQGNAAGRHHYRHQATPDTRQCQATVWEPTS